jgi:hypothetical protein
LYLGDWAESEAGQRYVSGKAAAQLSSTVGQILEDLGGDMRDYTIHKTTIVIVLFLLGVLLSASILLTFHLAYADDSISSAFQHLPVPTASVLGSSPVATPVYSGSTTPSKSSSQQFFSLEVAKLVLECVKALVWPAIVVILLIVYRDYISKLLQRVAEESEEISAFGIATKLGTVAKKVSRAAVQASEGDNEALQVNLREITKDIRDSARYSFRKISSALYGPPSATRKKAAREISEIAPALTLDDVLEFAESPLAGERIGAAICLREKIESSPALAENKLVEKALGDLLNDVSSQVRYRAVQAVGANLSLLVPLGDNLLEIAMLDDSKEVRRETKEILEHPLVEFD